MNEFNGIIISGKVYEVNNQSENYKDDCHKCDFSNDERKCRLYSVICGQVDGVFRFSQALTDKLNPKRNERNNRTTL